jgi:hypothetical protein
MSGVTPLSLVYVVVVCTGATLLSVDHDRPINWEDAGDGRRDSTTGEKSVMQSYIVCALCQIGMLLLWSVSACWEWTGARIAFGEGRKFIEYTFLAKGNRKVIWPICWDNVKIGVRRDTCAQSGLRWPILGFCEFLYHCQKVFLKVFNFNCSGRQ